MILKTEAKLVLREPIGIGFSIVLPLVLLLVFGLPDSARRPDPNLDGKVPIDTVMPSLALALSFGMLAVFMLPGFMTDYRSRGILRRLSTTPVHPAKLLGAQLTVQAAVALASLPLVLAVGAAMGMDAPKHPLALAVALIVGGAALFSLGSLVAALAPDPRVGWVGSAVIFFPSLFLAGVWLPKEQMPDWLARAGDFTPLGGFRTSVQDAWTGHALDPLILLALAATAVAVSALAARVFRWE
ncbi:ABC transporter permease [Solirubrobacter soli]|uniref:ABC transporter permease n=1 Tax=Solirubrobacter soli TaxID=363832 RepID=UPI00040AD4E1|nr:ABC transporter permease [Solirubrobacter soli]